MRLNVKVSPNAKNNRLVQEEGMSRVYLTISAKDPNPNKALIKFLATYFFVKKNMIRILTEKNKREKLVFVRKG